MRFGAFRARATARSRKFSDTARTRTRTSCVDRRGWRGALDEPEGVEPLLGMELKCLHWSPRLIFSGTQRPASAFAKASADRRSFSGGWLAGTPHGPPEDGHYTF